MSFLGVMIGLPYLHSLWHPQSKAGTTTQSKLFKVFINARFITSKVNGYLL
jgi:hypothetical protein